MSYTREVTLWREDPIDYRQPGTLIGCVHLPMYPAKGDVVRDEDANDWLVTGRRWHHGGGLVLMCKPC